MWMTCGCCPHDVQMTCGCHLHDVWMMCRCHLHDVRMTCRSYVTRQWQQLCIKPTGFLVIILAFPILLIDLVTTQLITVHNVVAARLCFYRHPWFCSWGVADTPPGRHPPGRPPMGRHPLAKHPPRQTPLWPLQRTVRILLKCILVSILRL